MKRIASYLGITLVFYSLSTGSAAASSTVEGRDLDDTIVYGAIFYFNYECVEWRLGNCIQYGNEPYKVDDGICVYDFDAGGTYGRGTYNNRQYWDDAESAYILKGEDTSSGTSDDYIYPADLYSESFIACGSSPTRYIAMHYTGYNKSVSFSTGKTLYLYGDYSTTGNGGDDEMYGWDNKDYMYGGPGIDLIIGGSGSDYLRGNEGADEIWEGTCQAGVSPIIFGDSGDDWIYGSTCADWIDGGSENDTLYGADGNDDYLYGGTGNDYLSGGSGTGDTCDGGDGTDTFAASCETKLNDP